jgi:hypothetical protein
VERLVPWRLELLEAPALYHSSGRVKRNPYRNPYRNPFREL